MKFKIRKPLIFIKIFNFEYWPWWFFYLPLLPYWLYLSIKFRSLTYFTLTNPSIPSGGFFGESKISILNKIAENYKPATIYFENGTHAEAVILKLSQHQFSFPIIIKPDVGERGFEVEKINSADGLKIYLQNASNNFIVQEFVDYDIELGIMFYRFPNQALGKVSSVTMKKFLTVTGDGNSTILNLLRENDRARFQIKNLKLKYGNSLNTILENGKSLVMEPIGNHCRGTMFLNGNHLINDELHKVFNKIASGIEGFYYGRFDMKVKSIEDLYNGKNIKILELNGVSAEPAHIYDPQYKLINAYSDLAFHWKIIFQICLQNLRKGHLPLTNSQLLSLLKGHFFSK